MALQLRRGTNAERLAITPALGEVIYVTDYDSEGVAPLFVGDGVTVGGSPVGASSLNFTSIEGNVTPDQDSTRDLGTNAERWANVYADDITVTNRVTGVVRGDIERNDGQVVFDAATGSITANITGSVTGSVVGHVVGSVFGDDSTQLVDGANSNLTNINQLTFNGGPDSGLREVFSISNDSISNETRILHPVDDEFARLTFVRSKATGSIPTSVSCGRILWNKIESGVETNFATITCGQDQLYMSVENLDSPHNFTKFIKFFKTGKFAINGNVTNEPAAELDVDGIARLTPQSLAPAAPQVGMIAVADGSNWDPASKGGTPDPYPAFYDGNAWVAMA